MAFFYSNVEYFNIFIDDFLGQLVLWDMEILFLISLFMMAMTQEFYPDNIAWAAFDLYQFGESAYRDYREKWQKIVDIFRNILPHCVNSELCSISHLQGVMRCSQGVYDSAYIDILWPLTPLFGIDSKKLRPHLGHKVIGMATIFIRDTTTKDNFLVKALALIDDAKERLLRSGFDFNCRFAIILSIQFKFFTLYNQIAYNLRSRFPNHTIFDNVVDGRAIEGNTIIVTPHLLSFGNGVHSLEWPLVIHICVPPKSSEDISLRLSCDKYLARSRAMTALVDILIEVVDW